MRSPADKGLGRIAPLAAAPHCRYNVQAARASAADLGRQLGGMEEALAPASAGAGLQRRLQVQDCKG
jgi:hypothetical protein